MDSEKILQEVKKIVFNYLSKDEYSIFLFGSRAKGDNLERSDFDVGIFGNSPVPWSKMTIIKDKIDRIPTLKKIDIIDLKSSSESFKKEAVNNSIKI